jgi:hypothetical protein
MIQDVTDGVNFVFLLDLSATHDERPSPTSLTVT